jgi:hypothetical protein
VEFSVPKMVRAAPGQVGLRLTDNLRQEDVDRALGLVSEFVERVFGLEPVQSWKAQRVDYAWMWELGPLLPVYMSVLQKLRISDWSRHPYDASEGVVWKSNSTKGRWVKFYNKTRELRGSGDEGLPEGVLRFEVSNYKDAVAYMSEHWFGGEQTVQEVTRTGRALYVMARQWERLGLGQSESYGHEEYLLFRLRDAFGTRAVPSAHYVLTLYDKFGTEAFREHELVKRSTYYHQLTRLRECGFLTAHSDGSESVRSVALPALHLPLCETLEECGNLKCLAPSPGAYLPDKILRKNWAGLSDLLGVIGPRSEYLLRRWRDELDYFGASGGVAAVDGVGRCGVACERAPA